MTEKEKQQFFALYWGQVIAGMNYPCGLLEIGQETISRMTYVLCTSIQDLNNEDAENIARILDIDYDNEEESESQFDLAGMRSFLEDLFNGVETFRSTDFEDITECIDYLRSKGYAIPWKGFMVVDLEANGVIKYAS